MEYYKVVARATSSVLVLTDQCFHREAQCTCGSVIATQFADLLLSFDGNESRDIVETNSFNDYPSLFSQRLVDACLRMDITGISFRPTRITPDSVERFAIPLKPYYQVLVADSGASLHPSTQLSRNRWWCKRCQRDTKFYVKTEDPLCISFADDRRPDFLTLPEVCNYIVSDRAKQMMQKEGIRSIAEFQKCEIV